MSMRRSVRSLRSWASGLLGLIVTTAPSVFGQTVNLDGPTLATLETTRRDSLAATSLLARYDLKGPDSSSRLELRYRSPYRAESRFVIGDITARTFVDGSRMCVVKEADGDRNFAVVDLGPIISASQMLDDLRPGESETRAPWVPAARLHWSASSSGDQVRVSYSASYTLVRQDELSQVAAMGWLETIPEQAQRGLVEPGGTLMLELPDNIRVWIRPDGLIERSIYEHEGGQRTITLVEGRTTSGDETPMEIDSPDLELLRKEYRDASIEFTRERFPEIRPIWMEWSYSALEDNRAAGVEFGGDLEAGFERAYTVIADRAIELLWAPWLKQASQVWDSAVAQMESQAKRWRDLDPLRRRAAREKYWNAVKEIRDDGRAVLTEWIARVPTFPAVPGSVFEKAAALERAALEQAFQEQALQAYDDEFERRIGQYFGFDK